MFEKQFTKSELSRALLIDEYKTKLYEHYDLNEYSDITKDEEKMKELYTDLKLFHQLCCWKML